jgi:hypothetical protein
MSTPGQRITVDVKTGISFTHEDYELKDVYEFNKKMMEYMLWYNIERPHHSLNKKHLYNTSVIL